MSDDRVRDLALRLGIAVEWTGSDGTPQTVAPEVLRRLLDALGFACRTPAEIAESTDRLNRAAATPRPLVTATTGEPILLPQLETAGPARLVLEDGTRHDVRLGRRSDRTRLLANAPPGYHQLYLGDHILTLALAPRRCFALPDAATPHPWGLAVQLYGLRRHGDGGIGDSWALRALVGAAAQAGADAVAISPTHALFTADRKRFGPYSPSSRLFLNPLYADPRVLFGNERVQATLSAAGLDAPWAALEGREWIDWPAAADAKLALLAHLFDRFEAECANHRTGKLARDFAAFRRSGGSLLEQHACFEVLHASQLARAERAWSWRQWPARWRDPQGAPVEAFAKQHAREVTFNVFLQWLADRSLAAVQSHALSAGMRIGLIADLAVGMDVGGSHAWARQNDVLVGLSVGAPPDLFNPAGQNWGVTTFSPWALLERGFEPFVTTLRAAMRHAGGVRIDHAMGLTRLWLIPEGAAATEGAYLTYPLHDLLRLVALESHRQRAIVIGEDLGTVPEGFRDTLTDAGILRMAVLWFERGEREFNPAAAWPRRAVAMTSTHDLPTIAGWWRGTDIALRAGLQRERAAPADPSSRGEEPASVTQTGRLKLASSERAASSLPRSDQADAAPPSGLQGEAKSAPREEPRARAGNDRAGEVAALRRRDVDRVLLWQAFRGSGVADCDELPDDPAIVVDAAVRFIAATPTALALLPLEDLLGLKDQPNLPGTVDEYPNWRRRYRPQAGEVFDQPGVMARARSLTRREPQ